MKFCELTADRSVALTDRCLLWQCLTVEKRINDCKEWVCLSDDPKDANYRLRLEDGFGGLITISEEDLTSRSESAQITNVRGAIDMTPPQARWLHRALTELLDGLK